MTGGGVAARLKYSSVGSLSYVVYLPVLPSLCCVSLEQFGFKTALKGLAWK